MVDKEEATKRILTEEDYIYSMRYSYSLSKLLAMHSDGVENATIARMLLIPEVEVERLYQEAVEILRKEMVDGD